MPIRCQRLSIFLAASLLAAAGACSSSTAPSDRSLEGPWTTGHSLSGLDAGFDLSWAADLVNGSGNYAIGAATGTCTGTGVGLSGSGTVRLAGFRGAGNSVRATLTFDTGLRLAFSGTLSGSGGGGTGTHIDGSFVAPDGTSCPWELIEGLIP